MFFKLILITFCCHITTTFASLDTLFLDDDQLWLPNEWSSVTDCPVRYNIVKDAQKLLPVYGIEAYEREFAHMAAIGWTNKSSGTIEWNCGGSLISENYIITAGHCASWNGKAPDVVRMGDLNLDDDTDDKYAQQLSIERVIVHPLYKKKYFYNDIALLKLNQSIKIHDTVCPACLWINKTLQFPYLEACGYGQTGFYENKTPKLLKVILSPVNYTECTEYYPPDRRLNHGLQNHQMCAVDRGGLQDTCLGDSGGPLQIKLLGGGKMNPFIIGITSFGKFCGTDIPAVYTRISSFIDWIAKETDIDTNPQRCVLKYFKYREYEPDVLSQDKKSLEDDKFHVNYPNHIDYMVQIGWKSWKNDIDWECYGVLITEKFVITLASCLKMKNKNPDKVKTRDNVTVDVKSVTLHPRFKQGQIDDDIALVEVMLDFTFNKNVHPACIYDSPEYPKKEELNLLGMGSNQILQNNDEGAFNENEVKALVASRLKPVNFTYCNQFYQNEGFRIDEESKICYGNTDLFLVPDACTIAKGAPFERRTIFCGNICSHNSYVFGLPVLANDCGFGFPVVATKLSNYIDWIDSVIFPKKYQRASSQETPSPVNSKSNKNRHQIEECPETYRKSNRFEEFAHLALIGYGKTREWHCRGNLISDKHILTSYECVNDGSNYDSVALGNKSHVLYKISKTLSNKRQSLTLITLKGILNFSNEIIPICLWQDKQKISYAHSKIVSKINITINYSVIRPHQSCDCKGTSVEHLITSEDLSCVSFFGTGNGRHSSLCTSPGTGVYFTRKEEGLAIPYLVGMLIDVDDVKCDEKRENVFYAFTRIAFHIDWIIENM